MGYWRENLNRHEPTIHYPPPPHPFQTLMSAFNGIMNDTGNFQKENNDSRQGFDATNKKIKKYLRTLTLHEEKLHWWLLNLPYSCRVSVNAKDPAC